VPGFVVLFTDVVAEENAGWKLKKDRLELLRSMDVTFEELLDVRHLVEPEEQLFPILLGRFRQIGAPLFGWCELADEATEEEQEDAIHQLALRRLLTVEADPGEIATAIGVRGPEDPIRKVLEKRRG
jgi:hypothetical protein